MSLSLTFTQKLAARWRSADSLLCVGLDPDLKRLPVHLREQRDAIYTFCTQIVDATADLVCAYKPQIAYFAAERAEDQLESLVAYIRRTQPDVPIILDAKRGDIGPTAQQYAREAYERYDADAVTLSPFMGFDSIEPYLAYPERGAFLLCRTSNAGGNDVQMLEANGERIYERIARLTATQWNQSGQLGLVVGATYPNELARVRALAPELPILVPGIGMQGGDIAATLKAGLKRDHTGLVINSSRAILYAGDDEQFAAAARAEALATRDAIRAAASDC